jgi:hypothetical protein
VLLNSHDGTSAYRVMSGVFRLVCLNGMIVADRKGAEVHVPHKGDVVRQVVEGSYAVLDDARRALDAAEAWRSVSLTATSGRRSARLRACCASATPRAGRRRRSRPSSC